MSAPVRAVLPEYRPTLGDLAAGWPRGLRWGLLAAAAAAFLGAGAWVVLGRGADEVRYVQAGPVAFNLRHPEDLARRPPQGGELLRLERRREDGLFLDRFAVEPLSLPAYRGEASGALPVFAAAEVAALRERFDAFEWVREGKTRINEVPGYAVQFRAHVGERRLFGRSVLLPEPLPGARRGARLLLVATPAAGVANASEVGSRGATKLPYRSFRFGTEAP